MQFKIGKYMCALNMYLQNFLRSGFLVVMLRGSVAAAAIAMEGRMMRPFTVKHPLPSFSSLPPINPCR